MFSFLPPNHQGITADLLACMMGSGAHLDDRLHADLLSGTHLLPRRESCTQALRLVAVNPPSNNLSVRCCSFERVLPSVHI